MMPRGRQRLAPDQRQVRAVHAPVGTVRGKLLAERCMRRVVFGNDQQARGSLVEAVHDAGTLDAADAGEARAAMGDERVDQGSAGMSGGRVHDDVGRLVDDDNVGILVDHIERDGLGDRLGCLRFRHLYREVVPRFDPIGPISYGRAAWTADAAGANEGLDACAAQAVDALGKQLVQADSSVGFCNGQFDALRAVSIDGLCHGPQTGLRMTSTTMEEYKCRRPKR